MLVGHKEGGNFFWNRTDTVRLRSRTENRTMENPFKTPKTVQIIGLDLTEIWVYLHLCPIATKPHGKLCQRSLKKDVTNRIPPWMQLAYWVEVLLAYRPLPRGPMLHISELCWFLSGWQNNARPSITYSKERAESLKSE
ncbi:hypothetical protein PoB_002988400 [Plakobranchus ocellatus]|uniref:Uncharacterized protein n=1 Tax=Plakobranchus ocellatus TaxID=259542 RepID=A0AAV4A6Q4_9GAST|nr:hypothetical protein PoB_002988400 [Plakobranchus ocellatus]